MKTVNFLECISALQLSYIKNPLQDKNYDFWYIVDRLDNKELLKWCDRLSHIKFLESSDWAVLCSILNQVKNDKHAMSPRQKRRMAIMLLKGWDEISMRYEY